MGGSSLNSRNLSTSNLAFDVPLGRVPGVTNVLRAGFNGTIDAVQEDIWNVGGLQVYLTSAELMDLVSTDANDTSAGTGAQTIAIEGIDGNFDEVLEVISLNGLTPVTTVNSFLRIYRMVTIAAGTTASNEGVVTITSATSANIQGQMDISQNSSSTFQYTIPRAKTGLLTHFTVTTGSNDQTDFSFFARLEGGVFLLANENQVIGNVFDIPFVPNQMVPEKTDIRLLSRQIAGGGSVSVTAILQLYLVDN